MSLAADLVTKPDGQHSIIEKHIFDEVPRPTTQNLQPSILEPPKQKKAPDC